MMNRPMVPVVSIIVVNWNGREHILRCLKCIHSLNYRHRRIQLIVVDNGSSDGSQEAIRRFLMKHRKSYLKVRFLKLGENIGVPSAMNAGLAHVHRKSSFVWKLDNDVTFPENYLRVLVGRYEREDQNKLGGIGGRIKDRDGVEKSAGAVLKSFPRRWLSMLDYRTASDLQDQRVAMIVGGSCLFPVSVFEKHGMFDERFFLYYDETEFCLRLIKAGRRLVVDPDAVAVHGIVSERENRSTRWIYYMARNHLLLGRCYFEGFERLVFYFLQTCLLPWKYFRMVVQGADSSRTLHRKAFIRAYADFMRGRFGAGSIARA